MMNKLTKAVIFFALLLVSTTSIASVVKANDDQVLLLPQNALVTAMTDSVEQQFPQPSNLQNFILTINQPQGNGKVSIQGGEISTYPYQGAFPTNATVRLQATPAPGWQFVGWLGDLTGSTNPVDVVVDRNLNITAEFVLSGGGFTLNVGKAGQGQVDIVPNQATYPANTSVTLTATPAAGWQFARWEGDASGSNTVVVLTMDRNKAVNAIFEPVVNPYTLAVNVSPSGSGSVTKTPNQVSYPSGSLVTLQATPAAGWRFVSWSGDWTGNANPVTITMDRNRVVTANFEPITNEYRLTVNVNGSGFVTKNPDRTTYPPNTSVILRANPTSGATFTGWSGDAGGTVAEITVVMDREKTVTASFTGGTHPPGETKTHCVQRGEWIYKIARQYGTSAQAIIAANPLYNPHHIYPGQCLIVPIDGNPPPLYAPKRPYPKPHYRGW